MATSSRLNLTRDQLASFLQDHEQIRQFERLFALVDELRPTTLNDIAIAAGNADQKAVEALDLISTVAQDAAIQSTAADQKAVEALDAVAQLAQDTAYQAENKALQALDAVAQLAQDTAYQADNKAQQALDAISQLSGLVELLATAPPEREFKRSRYGSFYSTATQTALVINTATEVTLNTTDLSSGVFLSGSPQSRINVDTDGIYNLQLSVQLDKTSGGTAEFYIWFRKNGVDVTDSASQIRIQGNNAEIFSALNYFFSLKAGDYIEIMFSVSNLSVELLAVPATAPHPGIPSIIVTVSNNIQGFQ
jgi:hypothetical protein